LAIIVNYLKNSGK